MSRLERGLYFALILGALITVSILAVRFTNQVVELRDIQERESQNQVETKQFLLSTIDWSTERQRTILFMRDIIISEYVRLGAKVNYEKAYKKSEIIFHQSEIYPGVDPLFMLAIQYCESRFLDTLVSCRGAIGPWQFVQSTGRLLCEAMGLTFDQKYLKDPITSTKLAGKYIGILAATYENEELMSADYNGGPWQAHFYRTDKSRLTAETSNFVACVKAKKEEFKKSYSIYKIDDKLVRKK
jgi:hypothetical protein